MPPAAFAASGAVASCAPLAGGRLSTQRPTRAAAARRVPPRMLAAKADAADDGEDDDGYWPGEYVCADCGFVYNNVKKKVKFEDLPESYKCPQCNASKRRFARKVGEFVEKTSGTDNMPIYAFSIAGLFATLAFFYWASQNL